jgi:hypothetical protein
MMMHVARRKQELTGNFEEDGWNVGDQEVAEEDDDDEGGNGKRAFGLTEIEDTGVNSEEEQAEVEGGQGTHQAFPAVPLPPSYLDDTLDALAKTMDLPPNHGGSIGSLSNGTFQTTTTSAVVQKPPRKVGPRPWFTHGGKSKMLVSSKSMGR